MSEPEWVPFHRIIDDHIPSFTDQADQEIDDIVIAGWADDGYDNADLAIRYCSCGERIDGFYEYAAHLKDEAKKAWS